MGPDGCISQALSGCRRPVHFFDYRIRDSVSRKLGWRVDHILATQTLAAKSKSCTIDLESRLQDKPSDHLILYAQW